MKDTVKDIAKDTAGTCLRRPWRGDVGIRKKKFQKNFKKICGIKKKQYLCNPVWRAGAAEGPDKGREAERKDH